MKPALRGITALLGIRAIDSAGFFLGMKHSLLAEAQAQGTSSTSYLMQMFHRG
jgi:hypothetical protein